MAENSEIIEELSELYGISPYYFDISGNKYIISLKTKSAILYAMGIEPSPETLTKKRLMPWLRLIEPVIVIEQSQKIVEQSQKIVTVDPDPISIPIHFPLKEGLDNDVFIRWSIKDEKADVEEFSLMGVKPSDEKLIGGVRYVRVELKLKSFMEMGYYDVDVLCRTPSKEFKGTIKLIITPSTAYTPRHRRWGVTTSLYSIHSKKSWGIGDLSDLKEFVKSVAHLGGGFVGLNPLHATANERPYGISPYSPISRLYRNFIYLNPETLPGFHMSEELNKEISALRESTLINYPAIRDIKERVLRELFNSFYEDHYLLNSTLGEEFKKYLNEEGCLLENFATFMAISKREGKYDFREWQEGLRDPNSLEVLRFKENNTKEVLFYGFLQWLIDKCIKEISNPKSQISDMPTGLYLDLAVGSAKGSADEWSNTNVFADGVSLGAPPDAFNPNGQDWGVSAFIPERLREQGYKPFIEIIRKNLRYAGALRIDHALGLFRAFFIPEGMSPKEGAYVIYPSSELLGIIALESQRAEAVIIAEDLGNVTKDVHNALRRFHMLSYRLFYFERNWPERDFKVPETYPPMALVATTTHDLPTLYGYWLSRDIEVKTSINLYPDDNIRERDIEERKLDKALMLNVLRNFLPEGFNGDKEDLATLCYAVYRFLSDTPCKLLSVSLEDILGVIDQQNMPGTINAYPNWCRKLPLDIKDIFRDERLITLASMLKDRSRR